VYDQLQLNDALVMKSRIDSMAMKRTRPVGMTEIQQTVGGEGLENIECEGSLDEAYENPPLVADIDQDSVTFDNVISEADDASDNEVPVEKIMPPPSQKQSLVIEKSVPVVNKKTTSIHTDAVESTTILEPICKPATPNVQRPSGNVLPPSAVSPPSKGEEANPTPTSSKAKPTPTISKAPKRATTDVNDTTVLDHNENEYEEDEAVTDDIIERQTLLRQLDLLRMKFKQSIIPPTQCQARFRKNHAGRCPQY
jgi:hypothetical protein